MTSDTTFKVPSLASGGLMLSYRCTNACRHCMYRCGPTRSDQWLSPQLAGRIFEALAAEAHFSDIHLAGGEAMLRPELLAEIIRLAVARGVAISYLETNVAWCVDERRSREGFARLRDAGLRGVLISASPFHNEFIPFGKTKMGIAAAREVFGRGGVLVWTQAMYDALSRLDEDRTHTVEEFIAACGLDGMKALRGLYPMTPHGRVVEALRECFDRRPAESFRDECCGRELASTGHFHIDPQGRLFTGHCPGIIMGEAGDYHPAIAAGERPVAHTLWSAGPYALMQRAIEHAGYRPRADGYVSKCDLCLHVRGALRTAGGYAEVGPADFYAAD